MSLILVKGNHFETVDYMHIVNTVQSLSHGITNRDNLFGCM